MQAGERGYQTLINETLRQAVERDDLEERLRRIIREEIRREAVSPCRQPPDLGGHISDRQVGRGWGHGPNTTST